MIENSDLERRHVLPRWLSISRAIETGVFARPGRVKYDPNRAQFCNEHVASLEAEFSRRERKWHRSRDVSDAEELISVALVARKEAEASVVAAANTVVSIENSGTAMKELSRGILCGDLSSLTRKSFIDPANIREEIRRRKQRLSVNPKDALLLTETALCHANLGQLKSSEKLLRRALAISPNSRFVLRATARFFCHDNRPDEAMHVLQQSPRLNLDPWLKAAELAIAGILGGSIKGWRKSRALAADNALSPRDRSELATELATFEFSAGARKAGLLQIRTAVIDPTENATAQIEFLAGKTDDFAVDEFLPDLSCAMEAQAYNSYRKGELRTAFEACEVWHELEPFSIRPAIFGSFLSTSKTNSIDRGIALGKAGLVSNPNNSILQNNLAVLFAYKGDIDAAEQFAARARISSEDKSDIANVATRGLIHFRKGEIEDGVANYQKAIEQAVAKRNAELAVRAYAFRAREITRLDPSLNADFRDEFAKIQKKLFGASRRLPRDVELIVTEFSEQGSETKDLLLGFQPFTDSDLEEILVSK